MDKLKSKYSFIEGEIESSVRNAGIVSNLILTTVQNVMQKAL